MLQAILSTTPGMVLASSAAMQNQKKLANNQAQGSLNPSGLVYVTLTESANEELSKQNQDARQSNEPIEGSLTALLSLNSGDPVAQVDYLNTQIMHEGGWLNSLLTVTPSAPIVEKTKKSGTKKGVAASAPSQSDEWGSPASNSATTPSSNSKASPASPVEKATGDNWGNPSTTSDWDTPGSSGGSKEEW